MTHFPWAEIMRLGLGRLRLPPQQFWAMSLRELAAALGPARLPMGRTELERLMREFPDAGTRRRDDER